MKRERSTLPAELLDGKAIARELRDEVAAATAKLVALGVRPGLAVVLVLIVLVQAVQSTGDLIARRFDKRSRKA